MPANEDHIGYVAHDKTCGLKKCQGSTPLCHFRKSIFSDGDYSSVWLERLIVAQEAVSSSLTSHPREYRQPISNGKL